MMRSGASAGDAQLSVVLFLFTSRLHLVRCIEALVAQQTEGIEIILAYDDTLADAVGLAARFPSVRMLRQSGTRTPPELRAIAVAASDAPVIAFLEDHCVPAPDWCERVLEAHAHGYAAVGGPVDKGFPPGSDSDSALNWAIYLTDYSRYMRPMPAGPTHALTDCNVSYKRAELDAIREHWQNELHENIVNGLLAERGRTLWLEPGMVVFEQRDMTIRSTLRDRYGFGRLFASTRVRGAPFVRRAAMAGAALLMPPILVARVGRNLARRGRHRGQFLRCMPALLFVTGTWMFGEAMGYLTGTPPASLRGMDRGASAPIQKAAGADD